MDSSVTLPDIGTWVAVRVTAVFNPGHFWVQFPYGPEPIENRIIAGMLQSLKKQSLFKNGITVELRFNTVTKWTMKIWPR